MTYINPNLKQYDSLKLLLDNQSDIFSSYTYKISDLLNLNKCIIISEPGYGKTRLLKECLSQGQYEGVFVDLKKIGKQDIKQFIDNQNNSIIIIQKSNNEEILNSKLFKTPNFTLENNDNIIFCFDALDEVKQEYFSEIVDNIHRFIKEYHNAKFFISCRKNYLQKWAHLFSESEYKYVEMYSFNNTQSKELFTKNGCSEQDFDIIYERKLSNIIQTPRYLEMFLDLLKKYGIDKVKNLSRGKIFELFINNKLYIETERTSLINKKEIFKKIFEKLALIMEIYQTNQITKDELIEFFDNTSGNLNISFLSQVSLDHLYDHSLIKDNIDTVEFENTEFQEYLAAKEISKLGRVKQVIYDLAVVKELREINPSWVNTLSFVIELDITLLRDIIEYILTNNKKLAINEEYFRLIPRHNIDALNTDDRRKIFELVFSYYQNIGYWVDIRVAETISYYYDETLYSSIENFINNKESAYPEYIKGNSAIIIAYLYERGALNTTQIEIWRARLIEWLSEDKQNQVVLREALFAVGKLKDDSLITPEIIDKLFKTNEDLVTSALIDTLVDINPESEKAITCFLRGLKHSELNIISNTYTSAEEALCKIKTKNGIKQILNEFVKNPDLIFTEHRNQQYLALIENIKNVSDDDVIMQLKHLISQTLIDTSSSLFFYGLSFINQVTFIIEQRFPDYIFDLIKEYRNNPNISYQLGCVIENLLKKEQVANLVNLINEVDNPSLRNTVSNILLKSKIKSEDIYEEGRRFFPNEYSQSEAYQTSTQTKQEQGDKIYQQFKSYLKPDPNKDMYNPNVFRYYIDNKQNLNPLQDADKARLEELITESILTFHDPKDFKIVHENGRFSYGYEIPVFNNCIEIAHEFKIDISQYRQKILNFIPFAYNDGIDTVFKLIINPTKQELQNVVDLYQQKEDDLKLFMPSNLIDIVKRYKIQAAIPLLEFFINTEYISLSNKQEALFVLSNFKDKAYFAGIFDTNAELKLKEAANEILIRNFKDDEAIDWRFNELKNGSFEDRRISGVYSVDQNTIELSDKRFAKPLMELKDIKYKEKFLKLLEESFEIRKQGENYYSYTSYLWEIAIEYFGNLKETRNLNILRDVEKFMEKHSAEEGINWLKHLYQKLKSDYALYIGKPQNIAECIKQYNFFQQIRYVDIATQYDLIELIKSIVDNDLRRWVEQEGAYKLLEIKPVKGHSFRKEDLIQKTIKTQFENALLKAGFRKEDLNIQRESQLLDDKKADFLISYGFLSPVLIELKLLSNSEITNASQREKYKQKLIQYIEGSNADFGFFIVFQVDQNNTVKKYLPKLQELYKDDKNIEVLALNCTGDIPDMKMEKHVSRKKLPRGNLSPRRKT